MFWIFNVPDRPQGEIVKNHVIKFKTKKKDKAPKMFTSGSYLKSPFVKCNGETKESSKTRIQDFSEMVCFHFFEFCAFC